jgi:hypothetical protein
MPNLPPRSAPRERRPGDGDELPSLPPLDDDGAVLGGDDSLEMIGDEEGAGLDDETGESDPLEAWGVSTAFDDAAGSSDDADGFARAGDDDHSDMVGGAERGLLEGSDEGDGRDVTADEAGLLADAEGDHLDDGGAEGTGEDPALGIDKDGEVSSLSLQRNPDDDRLDDESLEDDGAARMRAALEREPWPSRADVAWVVITIAHASDGTPSGPRISPPPSDGNPGGLLALPTKGGSIPVSNECIVVSEGDVVLAATPGEALWMSLDGGTRFERVDGCSSVSAVAIVPGAPAGRAAVAALYDASRDLAAIAVVRVLPGPVCLAEVVAELTTTERSSADVDDDDDDEHGRVESLMARICSDGTLEVIATGRFGARRARG